MNHTSPKTHLTLLGGVLSLRATDVISPCFRHDFNSFSPFSTNLWFSSFSPQKFASYLSRVRRAVTLRRRPILQTKFKGNFCLMTLYSHKRRAVTSRRLLTPKISPKNSHFFQTFSNSDCCPFAPPTKTLFPCEAGKGLGMGDTCCHFAPPKGI
jgi:hypothetical protein